VWRASSYTSASLSSTVEFSGLDLAYVDST
jgi:hypothetical protein